jgi:hypothetical protein
VTWQNIPHRAVSLLGWAVDFAREALGPPQEALDRGRVIPLVPGPVVSGLDRRTAESLAREEFRTARGRYPDLNDAGEAYDLGVRTGLRMAQAVPVRQLVASRVLGHYPVRRSEDGPIQDCTCGGLKWGDGFADHLADLAVTGTGPTPTGRTVLADRREVPYPLGDQHTHPPAELHVAAPGTVTCDGRLLSVRYEEQDPPVRRSSLEDVDPQVVEVLRDAGNRWGALGVALVAAHLTDPDVLVHRLRSGHRLGYRDTTLPTEEDSDGEKQPDPGVPDEEGEKGWTWIAAGQATEFLGRHIRFPVTREAVPEGDVVLESARFGHLNDGDHAPDVVYLKVLGHPHEYALTHSDKIQVRDR